MSLSKPYFRIFRPGSGTEFSRDQRYASDRISLINSYNLLEKDLMTIFEFIEPDDANINTYSHRLYELLLRASTEFETNATQILNINGYKKKNNSTYKISDYYLINKACKLSKYAITLNNWSSSKVISPFIEWDNDTKLTWYSKYNKVKHNRLQKFELANLGNVITAIAGVLTILVAQFDLSVQSSLTNYHNFSIVGDPSGYDEPISINSIFQVQRPTNWTDNEKYGFQWDLIKNDIAPFQKYTF